MEQENRNIGKKNIVILIMFIATLAVSLINSSNLLIWIIESIPVIVLGFIMTVSYRNFKFTKFSYVLALIYSIVLLVGLKYSYRADSVVDIINQRWALNTKYYTYMVYIIQGFTFIVLLEDFVFRKTNIKQSDLVYYFLLAISVSITQVYEVIKYIIFSIMDIGHYRDISFNIFESNIVRPMFMGLIGSVIGVMVFVKRYNNNKTNKYNK